MNVHSNPAPALTPTGTRYTFNRAAAEPILRLIEDRPYKDVTEALTAAGVTPQQLAMCDWIGLDGFDPAGDSEINGSVRNLIELAFSAGWATGPSEPYFEQTDHDGMCIVSFHVFGPNGNRVPLTLDWQDTADLIDRVPGDDADLPFHTGADAALDLLGYIVEQMNDVLARLDAYAAAQVAAARVEVVIMRDSDSDLNVETFLNGTPVEGDVSVIDNGGPDLSDPDTLDEWVTDRREDAETASPAAAACIIEYVNAEADARGYKPQRTWTFFGHWNDADELVIEHAVEGDHEDDREDDGTHAGGLWSDSGTGATQAEAEADVRSGYAA